MSASRGKKNMSSKIEVIEPAWGVRLSSSEQVRRRQHRKLVRLGWALMVGSITVGWGFIGGRIGLILGLLGLNVGFGLLVFAASLYRGSQL